MKAYNFFTLLVFAAALCACQKEQTVSSGPEGVKMIEVRAVFADGELSSKASLSEGSDQFEWNASDKVVAWDGSTATKGCSITGIDSDGVATFSIPEGSQWVIYPSAELSVSGNTATWTRPVSQKISASGQIVGDGANPMFGRVNGDEVEFTNMCGFIQFKFTGTKTLNKLSFKSNNMTSPALTGKGSIDVSADNPVLSFPVLSTVGSGTGQFGYTNVSGLNIALDPSTPTPVMVVLPPATYEAGELILEFNDGTALAIISTKSLTVERNTVLRVKAIDVDSRFPANPVALDANGRSNCYMVETGDAAQAYSFEAASILEGTTFDLAKTANIAWAEDKMLINNITYDTNTHSVSFLYTGGGREGNALIALDQNLQGAATTLLWNYHIWITDKPADIKIGAMPAPILDRNVGATWAPKNEAEVLAMTEAQWLETVGTYYQYGNHIPYPRLARAANSAANWDNIKVGVFYGFSNYCQRFANSGSSKATLAEQESYPNYQYHKSTGVKFGSGNETVWTQVVLRGGPTGEGENIWETKNGGSAKSTDYDPCPQGYCFISATHTYQATLNNECSTHKIGDKFFGKYNSDASEHFLYFPAAGYLGNSKNSLVNSRVVYWGYFVDKATDMGHIFRRAFMNEGNNSFKNDNQPFSSQAHNMRCALLATGE